MRITANTDDVIFEQKDMYLAFEHAYNLGLSSEPYKVKDAFKEWLHEFRKGTLKQITIEVITDKVLEQTGHDRIAVLETTRRDGLLPLSRFIIVYFAWIYTDLTADQITKYMSYKNHGSAFHATDVISDEVRFDKKKRALIDTIKLNLYRDGYYLYPVKRKSLKYDTKIETICT